MQTLTERLIRYCGIDTRSDEESNMSPSTQCQWDLARLLEKECKELGLQDVELSEFCVLTATIPAASGYERAATLGLLAHLDTSPETSGKNVKVQIHENYDGEPISLDPDGKHILSPDEFPDLKTQIGNTILTTDGTTLLGGDDKNGIAIIMKLAEYYSENPDAPHGRIRIGFTPDEEIGKGVAHFDPAAFGADYGYTLDGGPKGNIDYECFNAAKALVYFNGQNAHPGFAKGAMVNSQRAAMEFFALLPADEVPEKTEGREGYIHLLDMQGDVAHTRLHFILRDFDADGLEKRKQLLYAAAEKVEKTYGKGSVKVVITDQYRNMLESVAAHPEVLDLARQAIRDMGMEPKSTPLRGGTDGATVSNMENGFPCPNLSIGGHNCHGEYEYSVAEEMETDWQVLRRICELTAEKNG